MAIGSAGREAGRASTVVAYRRHRPEQTLLYRLVEEHYPAFAEQMAARDRPLPGYVRREFEDYLKCGRLEHGFLRVQCTVCRHEQLVAFSCKRRGFCPSCGARRMAESAALLVDEILPADPIRQWVLSFPHALRFLFATRPAVMSQVLGIVYRATAGRYVKRAGLTRAEAATGAVTLIQRFGSALNLNLHFHMLFLDGVFVMRHGKPRFRRVNAPDRTELAELVWTISERVGRNLERRGLLVRDLEHSYLALDPCDDEPLAPVLGSSITYRIAFGPREGQKAFTLQTLPARAELDDNPRVAKANGFSLHAGVAAAGDESHKRERLCRYITRPAVSEQRLSLTRHGWVRYPLKTPYRDGTTHVMLEPLDFIARLAALVPKPRVNLTRYHGVFAPNSPWRGLVTPARRGRGGIRPHKADKSEPERRAAMTWAQRLKRVFNIEIEKCDACGGRVKVIASIEDPAVIDKILTHLGLTGDDQEARKPLPRGPPGLFD